MHSSLVIRRYFVDMTLVRTCPEVLWGASREEKAISPTIMGRRCLPMSITYPDHSRCRIQDFDEGILECMVDDPSSSTCPFSFQICDVFLCNHPASSDFTYATEASWKDGDAAEKHLDCWRWCHSSHVYGDRPDQTRLLRDHSVLSGLSIKGKKEYPCPGNQCFGGNPWNGHPLKSLE